MSANSKIEWTDHTFNPWWGCQKVSPGCAHCYAASLDARLGGKHWGPGSGRRMFGDKHWNEPLKWSRLAGERGVRERVFCASMADVFEDLPELMASRARLFRLIQETPHLDWLLLTKRPENAERLWSSALVDSYDGSESVPPLWASNVWLGATAENQDQFLSRLPDLMGAGAQTKFLSIEPLLGYVNLAFIGGLELAIDWVIVGGESGAGARPMAHSWAANIRDHCQKVGIAFFFKQWGQHDAQGRRVGKTNAGRLLDGRTWDEFPRSAK